MANITKVNNEEKKIYSPPSTSTSKSADHSRENSTSLAKSIFSSPIHFGSSRKHSYAHRLNIKNSHKSVSQNNNVNSQNSSSSKEEISDLEITNENQVEIIKQHPGKGFNFCGGIIRRHNDSQSSGLSVKITNAEEMHSTLKVLKNLNSKNYKIIKLDVCNPYIKNEDLLGMVKLFGYLNELNLTDCESIDDGGLQASAPYLNNLKTLAIKRCNNITGNGLQALVAPKNQNIHLTPKIQNIHLSGSNFTDLALNVFDPTKLLNVNLSGCMNITDEGLQCFVPFLKNAIALDLSSCAKTDKALKPNDLNKPAAPYCPTLQILNLRGVQLLTGEGLKDLVSTSLIHLDLSFCDISDETFNSAAHNFINLNSLNLNGNPKITDVGVKGVAANCTNLQNLDLSECSFEKSGLDALIPHKNLRILNLYKNGSAVNIPAESFSLRRKDIQVNF